MVYRFPNLFGKWGRPDYNSVVATFCYNIARGLPIQIRDPEAELELVYIDDLVEEMLDALEGREHRCECRGMENLPDPAGAYCCVPVSHRVTLGRIAELLSRFEVLPQTIWMPEGGTYTDLMSGEAAEVATVDMPAWSFIWMLRK